MRKRAAGEEPFGSDSFLDVLANMVGILIILVVTTGIRMGRAPNPSLIAEADDQKVEQFEAPAAATPEEPASVESAAVETEPEPESDDPPAEISAELKAIAERMTLVDSKSQTARSRLQQLKAEYDSARGKLAAEQEVAEKGSADLKAGKLELARLEQALGDRKEALRALLAEFEEAKNSRPPAAEIRHRLAPVSQEILGPELHFRVAGGRVSVIPWDALFDRCKQQVERQKDWLATRGHHESIVGPIDGFSLKFVVERVAVSPGAARRLGYGAYHIRGTEFTIVPDPDLTGETAEQALKRGSKFALAVQTAPDHSALTFWVYPDSFPTFRKLQAACHAEGFVVCARPLSEDMAIRASPQGTASAGQ